MKIKKDEFFICTDTDASKKIEGRWIPTTKGGTVKINCVLGDDRKAHIVLITQTLGQRIFSAVAAFFTFGTVKHLFKTEKSIIRDCEVDFEEVKKIVVLCYRELIATQTTEHNINRLTSEIFSSLSAKKLDAPNRASSGTEVMACDKESISYLTPAQVVLAEKLKQLTATIVKNVLMFFMDPKIRTMSPAELREVLDVAQEQRPSRMEGRTEKFFLKMVQAINQMLDAMRGMPEAFEALARTSGDVEIRNKLVEGIAFPFINNLLQELDRENVSIVDSMLH